MRRRSNGQQFRERFAGGGHLSFPGSSTELAEAEAAREFEQERSLWEGIKASNDPKALEDYLRRYPSGRFSELAQHRLDQVLAKQGEQKVQAVSAPENPYTKGTIRSDRFRIGDSYTYVQTDRLRNWSAGLPEGNALPKQRSV